MPEDKPANYNILIVDDEERALDSFEMGLYAQGINNILLCSDSREVIPLLQKHEIGVVVLDLAMPHISGEQLLGKLTCDFPQVPVIIVTGYNEVAKAVECMREGAYDFKVKPVEASSLAATVRRACEFRDLQRENRELKAQLFSEVLKRPADFTEIVTCNRTMIAILKYVEAISESLQPVLVTGETGVGKELIVNAIHRASRCRGPLVAVNVASLDDTMFSDAIFGHQPGAFTGAVKSRPGLIEKAAGGTLFLDEIGDMSFPAQTKLLRLLQNQEYLPLGADEPHTSSARIVVATSRDLHALQQEGKFRNDLYYRLQTHHIHVSPLRERLDDDLPLLVDHFLVKAAQRLKKRKPSPPKELLPLLRSFSFPGNIRELESILFDAVTRNGQDKLSLTSIKKYIVRQNGNDNLLSDIHRQDETRAIVFPRDLPTLQQTTRLLLEEALARSAGKQTLAARMLGISPQALNQRLKRLSKRPAD